MMKLLTFGFLILASITAQAQVNVKFTNQELAAAFTLMRPELNSIELNGRTGVYEPAPSLKYLGVDRQSFTIDMGWIVNNVADLEFNHVKAKMPQVTFQQGTFQIAIPIEDRASAVQSRLGSISLKNVVVTASVGWQTRPNGRQELVLVSSRFDGQLSGTGILRSSLILSKTKELMMKLLNNQVKTILSKPNLQDAVQSGLLNWAKFYTGSEYHEVTAGSVQFFNDGSLNGISYSVQ
jgi:hypothetical protein